MPVLRGGGRGEMKECSQIAIAIFSGIVITCIVFFISRHLDFVFLNAFPSAICAVAKDKYIASFDSYKDFVTIITAILTLIVAALGIASYISFKEVRGKSKDIMDEFDQIRVTINQDSELPIGTYFYIVKYVNDQGTNKERSGYLYLNR